MSFTYDASGTPLTVTYNNTVYYYVTNIQGDVIAILNSSGSPVVTYTYDAWGKVLSTSGSMASTLGSHNPLRYRSYVYDQESGLYYLQSRYYDPNIGRFINADTFAATGQGLLGNNTFVYCGNLPTMRSDPIGTEYVVNESDIVAVICAVGVFSLVPEYGLWKKTQESLSRFVANTKADVKRFSRTLVNMAKERWDDSQPCVHHVVPQGCSCESASEARGYLDSYVQHPYNLVIIDYKTHRSIHSNGHEYCDLVNNTIKAHGVDRGMAIIKVSILIDTTVNGGYFYGWF